MTKGLSTNHRPGSGKRGRVRASTTQVGPVFDGWHKDMGWSLRLYTENNKYAWWKMIHFEGSPWRI